MPELGKATYVIDIESRDFERGLKTIDKKTAASAAAQNKQVSSMEKDWKKLAHGVDDTSASVDRNSRTNTKNRQSVRALGGDVMKLNQAFGLLGKAVGLIKFPAIAAGASYLAQALSALLGGATALIGALGPLTGALAALPALFSTIGQTVLTATLAFKPIVGVLKEMSAAHTAAGTSATKNASAQKSAAIAVVRAEQSLATAHRGVTAALKALSAARLEAKQRLQDLRLAAEGGHQSEERSILSLQQSRRELLKAETSGKASAAELKDLSLGVSEAELGVKESRLSNKRTHEELNKSEKKGIKHSEGVVSAKQQLAQAHQQVGNAAQAVTSALEAQTQATEGATSAGTKLASKLAELSPQAQKFAKYLYSLKGRLKDLQAAAGAKMFPGVESGIKFALHNFPMLEQVLEATGGAFGRVAEKAGELLGSKGFGSRFKKIGMDNTKTLERLGGAGLHVFDALSHVMVAAQPLVDWMTKLTGELGGWLDKEAAVGQKSGALGTFFEHTKEVMTTLGHTFLYLGEGLYNIFKIAKPLGDWILHQFEQSAKSLREWTDSVSGKHSLTKYFESLKPVLTAMGRLLHDVVVDFFKLGESHGGHNGFAAMLEMIRTQALPALVELVAVAGKEFGPALVSALVQIVKLATVFLSVSGPLTIMVKTIGAMAGFFNKLLNASPAVRTVFTTILATMAIIKGVSWAGTITGIKGLITKFGELRIAAAGAATAEQASEMGGVAGFLGKRGGVKGVVASAKTGRVAKLLGVGASVASAAPTTAGMLGGADLGAMGLGSVAPEAGVLATAAPVAPWVALAAAVGAVGVGLVELYNHSKAFRDLVKPITDAAVSGFNEIKKSFKPLLGAVAELAHEFGHGSELVKNLEFLWTYVKPFVGTLANLFKDVLVGGVKGAVEAIAESIRGIAKVFSGMIQVTRGVVEVISGILTLKFGKVWSGLKNIFGGGVKAVVGILQASIAPFKGAAVAVGSVLESVFGGVWDGVKSVFVTGVNDVIDVINSMIGLVEELPFIPKIGQISHIGGGTSSAGAHTAAGEGHATHNPHIEERQHKKNKKARGGLINLGAPSGDTVPAMLERNEYVLNKHAVTAAGGPRVLDRLNFGIAPRHGQGQKPAVGGGMSIGGIPTPSLPSPGEVVGSVVGAARGLAGAGTEAVLNSLPDPSSSLPPFFSGIGSWAKSELVGWVKGKNKKAHERTSTGGAGYIPGGGGSVVAQIGRILLKSGLNKIGAAGIIGNAKQESNWDPASIGSGGGGLWGFTTPPISLADLQAFAQSQSKPWIDVGLQTEFLLKNVPASIIHGLNKSANAAQAAAYFMNEWERPAVATENQANREAGARIAMRKGYARGGLVGMASGGYVWPFKHSTGLNWGETDEGVDFTGSGPISAVGDGVVTNVMSDWYLNQSLFDYQLTDGPKKGQYMYIAEGISPIPSVGTRFKAGDTLTSFAHGTANDSIETGFGAAGGNGTLAGGGSGRGAAAPAAGKAAYAFFKKLQAGNGWKGSGGAESSGTKGTPKPKASPAAPFVTLYPGGSTGGTSAKTGKTGVATINVPTAPLQFGALPGTIKQCTEELNVRRGELSEYRRALGKKIDAATKKALEENVKALKARIKMVLARRTELIRAKKAHAAVKAITSAGAFAAISKGLKANENAYNLAEEYATQVQSVEPTEEGAALNGYIGSSERPAYLAVLSAENEWRNAILGAEATAAGKTAQWGAQESSLTKTIDGIKKLRTTNPKAWKKQKGRLPGLEEEKKAVAADIKKTATETVPGWEGQLVGLQGGFGGHAPSTLFELAVGSMEPLKPGVFGGDIWGTQTTIAGLGLRGVAGTGTEPSEGANAGLYKQLYEESQKRSAVSDLLSPVFEEFFSHIPRYGGKFHSGGTVPGSPGEERTIIAEAGEIIAKPGSMEPARGSETMPSPTIIVEDGAVNADRIRLIWDEKARDSISTGRRRVAG